MGICILHDWSNGSGSLYTDPDSYDEMMAFVEELKKIIRIANREFPEAHKEVLLVLDATTGQNAIAQAKAFKEVSCIDGIVLTKLDGTAKGGIVITLGKELGIPVAFMCTGETYTDIGNFNSETYINDFLGL